MSMSFEGVASVGEFLMQVQVQGVGLGLGAGQSMAITKGPVTYSLETGLNYIYIQSKA